MLNRIVLRQTLGSQWLSFSKPMDVLSARDTADVLPVLIEVERRVNDDNLWAAGFVCFEAASGFDGSFATHTECRLPLLCFGIFSKPKYIERIEAVDFTDTASIRWNMTESREIYRQKLATIKRQIEFGNTYQVNYTVRQRAENVTDPWGLFVNIAADAPYAAYVDCADHSIVSASPELFFRLEGEELTSAPMKGTAARGMILPDDLAFRRQLHDSAKDRAENVMITDMLRNDMGRVAKPGSVSVSNLFDIEKYETVWQMTSSVVAKTNASVFEVFQALFPCASITGAPKVSSLAIIAELEDTRREIYTGAIGYMAPQRRAQFNVAIRTALVDKITNEAVYGVGGGIVWDSDSEAEYDECLIKAKVLSSSGTDREFQLLETMLWTPQQGFFLFQQHLERLRDSATYFDFKFDQDGIEVALRDLEGCLADRRHRIRLLLQRDGQLSVNKETISVEGDSVPQRLGWASEPIDPENPFLYHKTTKREVYERALREAGDVDDVLLWNAEGHITETTIANVVVQIKDELFTPPVECGLLAGTYRNWLLEQGEVKEREIEVGEIAQAKEVMLINSVRGKYCGCVCDDLDSKFQMPASKNADV